MRLVGLVSMIVPMAGPPSISSKLSGLKLTGAAVQVVDKQEDWKPVIVIQYLLRLSGMTNPGSPVVTDLG